MQCPKCNSENSQRLEVIYNHGTQTIDTSTAMGVGYDGGFAYGVGFTSGTSQSNMAKKVSPPQRENYGLAIFLVIIGILIMIASLSFGLVLIGLGILLSYGNNCHNLAADKLHKVWLESWMCNKCGTIYHMPGFQQPTEKVEIQTNSEVIKDEPEWVNRMRS